MARTPASWERWAGPAVLLLAGLVFANALGGDFVFDDRMLIEQNPRIAEGSPLLPLLVAPYHGDEPSLSGLYRPLTLVGFALERRLLGLQPLGYHLVNVLLHVAVVGLLIAVARRSGLDQRAAWIGGALFAVHPVHVEAVANIAGRAELIAAAGVLGALWAYDRACRAARPARFLALSAGAFLVGLGGKESAATFLGVALGWELLVVRSFPDGWRAAVRRLAVLLVPLVGYLALRFAALGDAFLSAPPVTEMDNPLIAAGAPLRVLSALAIAWRYLALIAAPIRLSADYSFAQVLPLSSIWAPIAWLTLAGTVLLAVLAWRVGRRSRPAAFWIVFALVTFSIAANVVVPIGTVMAERLLFLPSAGLLMLAGQGAVALYRRWPHRGLAAAAAVVLALLAARTVARNADWRDGYTLFASAVAVSPNSARVHHNLGVERFKREEIDVACDHFARALEIREDYAAARVHLSHCRMRQGDLAAAEREARRALEDAPGSVAARYQLAETLHRDGRPDEAEELLERIVEDDPDHGPAHQRLGAIELSRGDLAGARRRLDRALALLPESVEALNDLALLEQAAGRGDRALRLWSRAVALSPDSTALLNNYADALRQAGDHAGAEAQLQAALAVDDTRPATWFNLGLAREDAGRLDQALEAYARARELRPEAGAYARAVGRVRLAQGDAEAALAALDEAIELDPADRRAYAERARVHERLGRLERAEADYLSVLTLDPSALGARNNLGVLYARRGRTHEARRQWLKVLEVDPDNAGALRNLALLEQEPLP